MPLPALPPLLVSAPPAAAAAAATAASASFRAPSLPSCTLFDASDSALDSAAFNPDRHVAQMLATYPLDKMLAEHRAVAREIKHLDGDMQQLVYENYSKFIAATDTIRAMKAQVDGLEGEMAALRGVMGECVGGRFGEVDFWGRAEGEEAEAARAGLCVMMY